MIPSLIALFLILFGTTAVLFMLTLNRFRGGAYLSASAR
jgi:hypothetical protein